ncbi:putative coiled-coil domain-containing protein 144C isoform X2 [Hylobates moloch]|uniref:putative coiled-coil domain-containing protein 144C isoform X2 n=1 Tax=Hylobates moloch TaxID=81572 RepID=UPI0026752C07|nr:putative coiled-coil domain-containing protein 144C isoform X2 [Hylobates moloch]
MKRSSGLGGQKAQGPSGSFTCWWCCRGDDVAERDDSPFAQCGYNIREKHLGKLHRAASLGEVSKVERILSRGNADLDERDKKKRTALHLACANGHPEVVALLVDRGCQLDVFDNKNRTALLKAVQCQEKECATILLEHGADPDFPDVYGNTTLHYATYNEDIPMTKKLLLHHANIETANKDELTPFLLAVHEEKQQMIEFLRKQKENLTAVKFESIQQVMSEYKENKTPRNPQNSNPVDEIPGNPVKRLFNKSSIDDSRPMSANEDFDFDTEISHEHKKEKDLLHKNCMLQEEIARLRLEIDTEKNRNQQKENNYLEEIKIVKEKNDFLQNTLKLTEETFATMIFQDSIQPEVLKAENKMFSFKLEDKNQNQERLERETESYHKRLERETESYRCRLVAAIQDCDQSQASKRDVELDFQRTRQEWFHLKEKMNFDMSSLKDKNELLSEKLSNAENKIRSLKMKLHQTKDALREKTLVLEDVQRELTQSQHQRKEIEQMFQNEEGKELDEAHKKADNKEETIINIQEQFNAILKDQAQEQSLLLEQKNNLINKCNFIEKRLYKYEKEKAERNADLTEAVETASSEGLHMDAEIEVLQQALLYMKTMQEKCETLQKDQERLEEELVNLKSHMEMNVLERGELEHHKREFEERARQEIAEQLATAGLLLQMQKIADVKLQLLTEERKATKKSQMELRIKELEFKLYKAKTSQADCNTTELEKYKELYLEELKLRESLSDELNKRKEILADVSSKLLQEKEQSGSLFTSHTTRPVLESACNGNLNEHLGLNRIHIPRENLRIPTLSSLSSNIRMESDLSKVRYSIIFSFLLRLLI